VHVLALRIELRLPGARSLKEKRARVRPIVDSLRARQRISVAEVDHQDDWRLATIGAAIVSGSAATCSSVGDEVERFVWSRPDVEVLSIDRTWMAS
jgi:uncharacterized protein YlxP (DUF503 family)